MLRARLKWFFLDMWPFWAMVCVVSLHWLAVATLPFQKADIHKYAAVLMQIIGGLVVVVSLNANLGLFRQKHFASALAAWLKSYPRANGGSLNIQLSPMTVKIVGHAPTLTISSTSIEDRMRAAEKAITELRDQVRAENEALQESIEGAKASLEGSLARHGLRLEHLAALLDKVTVGGIKPQVFGVTLASYGAITSLL